MTSEKNKTPEYTRALIIFIKARIKHNISSALPCIFMQQVDIKFECLLNLEILDPAPPPNLEDFLPGQPPQKVNNPLNGVTIDETVKDRSTMAGHGAIIWRDHLGSLGLENGFQWALYTDPPSPPASFDRTSFLSPGPVDQ